MHDFLFSNMEVQALRVKRLPPGEHLLDNAAIILAEKSNPTWCLICDSSAKIVDMIERYFNPTDKPRQVEDWDDNETEEKKQELVIVRYSVSELDIFIYIFFMYNLNLYL